MFLDPVLAQQAVAKPGLLAEKAALKLRDDLPAVIETVGERLVPVLMDSR